MVEIVRRQMDLNRLRVPKHCKKKKKKKNREREEKSRIKIK